MSGSLELYRTTVNLRGLGSGALIEIDPEDPAWAGDIRSKRIVPVEVVYETVSLHVNGEEIPPERWHEFGPEPGFDGVHFGELPIEPWAEQFTTNGEGEDGSRWPVAAPRGGFPESLGDWSGGGRWMDAAGESGPQ